MLKRRNEHIFSNALRYFGGITSSEDKRIPTAAVKNLIFDRIADILYSSNFQIVKEAVWVLSNITATQDCGIQKVFNQSPCASRVLTLASINSQNQDVRKESLWTLCNHVTCGEPEDIRELFLME